MPLLSQRKFKPIHVHDSDVIQFVHIPKTGGTSLDSFLTEQFEDFEIFHIGESIKKARKRAVKTNFRNVKYIHGHSKAGLYKIIGAPVKYTLTVTMLRDPKARLISNYNHIMRHEKHEQHADYKADNVDLVKFSTHEEYYYHSYNVMTHFIAGSLPGCNNPFISPRKYSDQAILEIAKQRLEQFSFFGITEKYEKSLKLLCRTFDFALPETIPRLNTAPVASLPDELPEHVIESINQATELDQALYEYANELFNERYQSMQSGK